MRQARIQIHKVMIMGGGRIAVRLAHLASADYDMTIIDDNLDVCHALPEKCSGTDVKIIHGDARNNDLLLEENIGSFDAFVALTEYSETNILACLTAKEMHVSKTVAEVENIQFISEAEGLNIGTVINKKLLASSKISSFCSMPTKAPRNSWPWPTPRWPKSTPGPAPNHQSRRERPPSEPRHDPCRPRTRRERDADRRPHAHSARRPRGCILPLRLHPPRGKLFI